MSGERARDAVGRRALEPSASSVVSRWHNAAAIRDYVLQLQQHADSALERDVREEALEWVRWMRNYADRTDPVRQRLKLPEPPEPSPTALAPFMGRWSPYGPS